MKINNIIFLHHPSIFFKSTISKKIKPIIKKLSKFGNVYNYFFKFHGNNKFELKDLLFENVAEDISVDEEQVSEVSEELVESDEVLDEAEELEEGSYGKMNAQKHKDDEVDEMDHGDEKKKLKAGYHKKDEGAHEDDEEKRRDEQQRHRAVLRRLEELRGGAGSG